MLGWGKLETYDEVIFMNFTIVGPLYPFKEMFDSMAARNLDFWGINVHSGEPYDPWGIMPEGYIPKHLQSHFITVRRSMLKSAPFQRYWDTMRPITSYQEAIGFHEAIFTKTFEDQGFTWDSYINTEDLEGIISYPLMFMPREVLINRRCPVFKRKALILPMDEYLGATHGLSVVDTLACLKELNYDLHKVLPNILRTGNQYDIRLAFNATQILAVGAEEIASRSKSNAAVVAYVDSLQKYISLERYLSSLVDNSDVYIYVPQKSWDKISEKLKDWQKVEVVEGEYIDFLQRIDKASRTYDFLGVLGFTNPVRQQSGLGEIEHYSYGLRALFAGPDTMIAAMNGLNDSTVYGGFASPPTAHAGYSRVEAMLWQKYHTATGKFLRSIGVKVDVGPYKAPLSSVSGIFWLKSNALRNFNWSGIYEELRGMNSAKARQVFNLALPFMLQQEGFLMAYGMSHEIGQNAATLSMPRDTSRPAKYTGVIERRLSRLYLVKDERFSEGNTVVSSLDRQDDGTFRVEFVAPFASKHVRFDPVEQEGVICKDIRVTINGVHREAFPLNAVSYAETDIFITNDPQYEIEGQVRKGDYVAITFNDIDFYSKVDFSPEEMQVKNAAYGGPLRKAFMDMKYYYEDRSR